MIIIGYPAIGKSTMARNCDNVIDLESSCFNVGNSKIPNWHVAYCQVAMDLSKQLNTVFVSSHDAVRKYFESKRFDNEIVAVCYPILDLREEWIEKLRNRWMITKTVKDYRAFKRAREHFEEDIIDLTNSPFDKIEIYSMDYDLDALIRRHEP